MRRPRTEWHQEVLDSDVLENLNSASEDNSDQLRELAGRFPSPQPGETPEQIAKQIGFWMVEEDDTGDFSTPATNDVDGEEGERMAMGYIGVKALEFADIGTTPDI